MPSTLPLKSARFLRKCWNFPFLVLNPVTRVKQTEDKRYFSAERIQRKKRDAKQLLNKYATESVNREIVFKLKALTEVELYLKVKEEQEAGIILNKKTFNLSDTQLLALVTKLDGKIKVLLTTDFKGPLTLHWPLSVKAGEWSVPPSLSTLPDGSVS